MKIVVVPDSSAAQKVPAVDGLLEYRKDKQELYVRSNKTWNVLASENKVELWRLKMITSNDNNEKKYCKILAFEFLQLNV